MTPTLTVGLALALGAPALKERAGPDPLYGRWTATGTSNHGTTNDQWMGLDYQFSPGGQWVIYRNGVELGGGPRSFARDPKAGPAAIDLTEGRGTYPAIYRVEGDVLSVAMEIGNGGNRPTGFDPAPEVMTFTFRRVKGD